MDEVKKAILNILNSAAPVQLAVLVKMLEDGYLRAAKKELNDFFRSELESIKAEYNQSEADLEKETLRRLADLA